MRGRRAVIGAEAVVVPRGAPELGERHHGHPAQPGRVEHLEEALDAGVQLAHPRPVLIGLAGVTVEIAIAGRHHAESEVGVDQTSRNLQPGDDVRIGELVRIGDHGSECLGEVELIDERLRNGFEPLPLGARLHVANRLVLEQFPRGVAGPERRPLGRYDGASGGLADEMERHRVADLGRRVEIFGTAEVAIEPATQPARRRDRIRPTGHPVRHRVEVRQIGIPVTDTVDDRQFAAGPTSA